MPTAPPFDNKDTNQVLGDRLKVLEIEQEERLARRRAAALHLPYINLILQPLNPEDIEQVPREQVEKVQAVLFYKHGRDVRMAAINPEAPEVKAMQKELAERFSAQPQLYVISRRSLLSALKHYRPPRPHDKTPAGQMMISEDDLAKFEENLANLREFGKHIVSHAPTEVLSAIVAGAVKARASDIHIEPKEKEARLRYRIDGVLHDIATFERDGWRLLLSRIKVLTKLKLNIRDVPQDGSFILFAGKEIYDVRVSTLPGGYGENIVMRLLNRSAQAVKVVELGMKPRDYHLVQEVLKRANGMILVTGPTGSGKTTTLASFINEVNNPELKIITLEDPIEYRLPGVEQTQVDESGGYTFARGLRSILRQDPDMILVGEMRDAETAETAVQAALTGHLVFSTLHTNNAAGAIPRLINLGIKPFVLAPAMNMVIAQRLVRVVCRYCSESYIPDKALREHIRQVMRGVRQDVFDPKILQNPHLQFLLAKGCNQCGHTGYWGRKGVFEIFMVDETMKQLILEKADGARIQEAALKQGMTTISQDGFLKVINHITTVDEVGRISEE